MLNIKRYGRQSANNWRNNMASLRLHAYILASIIEEETNVKEDKGNMASVYMNRMNKGIRLGADPTVKFALKDFSLKRIYEKHTAVESPYNTYRNLGSSPRPYLHAHPWKPLTKYSIHLPPIIFSLLPKVIFQKGMCFTETYADHLKYAKEYHKALDQTCYKKNKLLKKIPEINYEKTRTHHIKFSCSSVFNKQK